MVFLLGPTASGKTRLAMEVARRVGAEIVSLDAFQIYRGMDIGTAKPTRKEREEIPHHLLDLVNPTESFSSADYKREGERVVLDMHQGNRRALWVGGTGLYHRVMTQGLSPAPRTDKKVAEEIEIQETEEMAEEVRRIDPEWAKGADLRNRRRMVRALAVWRQTGRTMTDWQRNDTVPGLLSGAGNYVLLPAMGTLSKVIEQRVRTMLEGGWIEEVRVLLRQEGWTGSPGSRAIGYEQVAMLIEGKMGKQEACEKIVAETRAYAKRQLTWFRGLTSFQPIEIDPQLSPAPNVVEILVTALSK
ncbi:MAG: tRNA (adenosine(37)-N6)-dimethylallyltransferase MiaA [Verrucomicrobia bacterium]|nr:tRNA (adenosine(37)-N6)-dimethylallyltransferase MiaA [Verrucomicrobiota bacterium]